MDLEKYNLEVVDIKDLHSKTLFEAIGHAMTFNKKICIASKLGSQYIRYKHKVLSQNQLVATRLTLIKILRSLRYLSNVRSSTRIFVTSRIWSFWVL